MRQPKTSMFASLILCFALALQITPSVKQEPEKTSQGTEPQQQTPNKASPSAPAIPKEPVINSVPNESNGDQKTDDTQKPAHDWIDELNAFSTLVIALFTVALFGSVVYQVRDFRTRERSWMMVEVPNASPLIQQDGIELKYRFMVETKNFGETPATIVDVECSAAVLKSTDNLTEEPSYRSNPEGTPYPLAPKAGNRIILEIDGDGWNDIGKGTRRFYLFGRIIYRDIFKKRHETRFCYRWYAPRTDGIKLLARFVDEGPPEYFLMT
jgi:hypothetical protein